MVVVLVVLKWVCSVLFFMLVKMFGMLFLKNVVKLLNELMFRLMYDVGSGVLRFVFICVSVFGSVFL